MIKDDFNSFCKNYLTLTPEISISVCVGGTSGGNCYGDKTKPFDKEDDEILDDIKSSLQSSLDYLSTYFLPNYTDLIEQIVVENGVDGYSSSNTDSYDYYGNSSEYQTYCFDVKTIFNSLLAKNDDKELFFQCVDDYLNETNKKHQVKVQADEIKKINDLIKNFDKTKKTEKKILETKIKQHNQVSKKLLNELNNFDKSKDEELERLKTKLFDLQNPTKKSKTKP